MTTRRCAKLGRPIPAVGARGVCGCSGGCAHPLGVSYGGRTHARTHAHAPVDIDDDMDEKGPLCPPHPPPPRYRSPPPAPPRHLALAAEEEGEGPLER